MLQFFHGWRRKAGCLALVMACALCGAWVRSLATVDMIADIGQQGAYDIYSANGAIHFDWLLQQRYGLDEHSRNVNSRQFPFQWLSFPATLRQQSYEEVIHDVRWDLQWCGFQSRHKAVPQWLGTSYRFHEYAIPYWSIVLPLTLLSAYLILWKPQKQKTSDQPTNPKINSN